MKEWFENKDIALVGNAQSLFNNNYGDKIESADIVCRLNRGVIIQDTKKQGVRTDVWGIGVPKFVEDIFDDIQCNKKIHLSFKDRKYPHPKINFYLPMEMIKDLQTQLTHSKPSSGLAMLYYINLCSPKNIILYGFDWKATPTWYKEEGIYRPHNWDLERQFVYREILVNPNVHICQN